jgi:hypothetical protein
MIWDYDQVLSNLKDEIDALYERASGVSSPGMDSDHVQMTITGASPQERILPQLLTDLETYKNKYNRYLRLRKKRVDQINRMSDWRYCRILYLTYIRGWHSPQIAEEMGYNIDYIRVLRGEALKAFDLKYLKQKT